MSGDIYGDWAEEIAEQEELKPNSKKKKKRSGDLKFPSEIAKAADWVIHTDYHWTTIIEGEKIDYWPTKAKFRFEGQTKVGEKQLLNLIRILKNEPAPIEVVENQNYTNDTVPAFHQIAACSSLDGPMLFALDSSGQVWGKPKGISRGWSKINNRIFKDGHER